MSPMTNYLATLISSNGADEVTFVGDNAYSSPRCRTRKHCTSITIPSPTHSENPPGEETDSSSSCDSSSSTDCSCSSPPQELGRKIPTQETMIRKANNENGREDRGSMIFQRFLVAELELGMARSCSNESLRDEGQENHNNRTTLLDMIDEIQDVLYSTPITTTPTPSTLDDLTRIQTT